MSRSLLLPYLATAAILVACSPAADAADEGSAPEATIAAASDASCFVRGADLNAARERPSPLTELRFDIGGDEVLFCYGAPSSNNRTMIGGVEAFGSPWRLGANEATAIHLPFAAEIGGVAVEPGTYSIYAVPGESEWEFFVNSNYERWGIPINDDVVATNIGSFTRPVASTANHVETLTFTWQSHGDTMGHVVMEWENTRVEIPVHRSGS